MSYFRDILKVGFTDSYINRKLQENITTYKCYARYHDTLTPTELRETERSIYELTRYLLQKDKLIFPSSVNGGKLYRTAKVRATNTGNDFFPLKKSAQSITIDPDCNFNEREIDDDLEPVWFSYKPLLSYLNLSDKPGDRYGIETCRKISDIICKTPYTENIMSEFNNKFLNMFIDFGSNIRVNANNCANNNEIMLLDKDLQTRINHAIIIIIVRNYTKYNKTYHPNDILHDYIRANFADIELEKTVCGYHCDSKYRGGTVSSLVNSWSAIDGTRYSIYNQDRIVIQVLFEVLTLVEDIINNTLPHNERLFKERFINSQLSIAARINNNITPNVRINLLGWVCPIVYNSGAQIRNGVCPYFDAEWAISVKRFKPPYRYAFFEQNSTGCEHVFYKYKAGNRYNAERVSKYDALNGMQRDAAGFGAPSTMHFTGGIKPSKNIFEDEDLYTKKPESKDNDLYQVFFEDDPKEQKKYADISKFSKKFSEGLEKFKIKKNNIKKSKTSRRSSRKNLTSRRSSRKNLTSRRSSKKTKNFSKNAENQKTPFNISIVQ